MWNVCDGSHLELPTVYAALCFFIVMNEEADVHVASSRWQLSVCFSSCLHRLTSLRLGGSDGPAPGVKMLQSVALRSHKLTSQGKNAKTEMEEKCINNPEPRWKTELSLPQGTAICSLWFNAKINANQCWDEPQWRGNLTLCTAAVDHSLTKSSVAKAIYWLQPT